MTERDPVLRLRELDPATDERVDRHLDEAARSRIEGMARDRLVAPEPVHTRPAGGAHRPRRRWGAVGVAAAVIAGVVVAVLGITSTDYEPKGPLAGFASTAMAQEQLTPFEYVDWVYQSEDPALEGFDRQLQIWAGAEERFELRRFSLDGSRAGGDAIYTNRVLGVQCRGAVSGSGIRCETVESLLPPPVGEIVRRHAKAFGAAVGADETPVVVPVVSFPVSFDRENLWEGLWLQAPEVPTDQDELRAGLEEQIAGEFEHGIQSFRPTTGPAEGYGYAISIPPPKLSELPRESRSIVLQEGLFSKLTAILSNPYTPPELRASAFELLGSLPAVTVEGEGGDSVRITFDRPSLSKGKLGGLESYELEIDPETTQVLGLTRSARHGTPERARYELRATETFLERRAVGELPPEAELFRRAAEGYEPPPESP